MILTKSQARKIILHAAGLTKRGQFGRGKEAVYKMIDHLGFVQIDTNYVVERAHHHSIYARVPNYRPDWLQELQSEERIFEFWTFATGFIPIHDFRFSLPIKDYFLSRRKAMTQLEINTMRNVLDRISREGPLRARDFENDRVGKSSGWWDWRPSKLALERLHLDGSLTTTRKKDFQKVYDLTDNVIPGFVDRTKPSETEFTQHIIRRALKSLGVALFQEIAYSSRFVKGQLKTELEKMVESGEVCRIDIEGLKGPYYMLSVYKKKKISLSNEAFILSPFDILNIYRRRLREIFEFDYQVECFVPAPKRKYGYFSLPVLIGDKFVARMDSKADRKERVLTVNNLHFEPVRLSKLEIQKVNDAITDFAKFNECREVVIKKTNGKAFGFGSNNR